MTGARVLALSALVVVATLAATSAGADPTTEKELVEAARAYLDPANEAVYAARKHFEEALATRRRDMGIDALGDLDVLRQIINQGRGFLPDFSDKSWRKSNNVGYFKKDKGVYYNLESERMRFTYVQPKQYPSERDFGKIPRGDPYPLLMAFHEPQDTYDSTSNADAFPGQAVLMRRYPKKRFPALYQDWFMLAPSVVRAKWMYEDGALRHAFSTATLQRFWRHAHVDFDRIVLDGKGEAALLASVFPNVFAGMVLRGGHVDLSTVPNFAAVPVFVVEDPALERALRQAGHPDVRSGDRDALTSWLQARKRRVPASFDWVVASSEHVFANWIHILETTSRESASGSPLEPMLRVRYVDTESDPNTLRIDGWGVESIRVWLNDDVVDLDRDVRLVLNGEVRQLGLLERSLSRTFETQPGVRRSMYYGWLYPVDLGPLTLPPRASAAEGRSAGPSPGEPLVDPATEELDPPSPTSPTSLPTLLSLDERLELQHAFLRGRPDTIDAWLRPVPERAEGIGDENARLAAMAEAMYPLALRDLWWRTTSDPDVVALYRRSGEQARGLTARRLGWILGGGDGPYPEASGGETDGWPVLTTLVLDRLRRERRGKAGLPAESPLATRPPPDAWEHWWTRYTDDYLGWWMRRAYEGDVPETLDDVLIRERADLERLAAAVKRRNLILAVLTAVGLVVLTLVVGFRRPRRETN